MRAIQQLKEYFHAAVLDEWDGLERINRDLRLADLFTLMNAITGMAALFFATRDEFGIAVQLVMVGVILDGVDGAVARLGKGNGPLGGVLDTLADAVTFVTTSAVVAFLWIAGTTEDVLERALLGLPLIVYVVCGLLRLARFESLRDDGKDRQYFSGIPTPAAAITLLALVLVGVEKWMVLTVAAYLGILMVSRIRFPKMRGWWAVASLTIILAVLITSQTPDLQDKVLWGMIGFMALYVFFGPFLVLARYGITFPRLRGA